MAKNNPIEIAVIGTGRFGRFWVKHLYKYFPVYIYDVDPSGKDDLAAFAKWTNLDICLEKQYIFLTIPIRQIAPFLKENKHKLRNETVLIDCASIKVPVMEWFEKELPDDVYYIASHPLFGPDSARTGLKDHIISLIPGRIPYAKYDFLVKFFSEKLGLRVENIPADEHDRLMAYNLSLIHHLGRTFHGMNLSRIPLMMDSLNKLNSISKVVMNDSEELFCDFYQFNKYSKEVDELFENEFDKIIEGLL